MTVFKNYFKIAKKSLPMIIMYIAIFGIIMAITAKTNGGEQQQFTASKPDIAIINKDEQTVFIDSFEEYIKQNAELKEIQNDETSLKDALFFGEVDYILIIPQNYTKDFLEGKNPKIETMKVPDSYGASYCEMLLNRYLNIANIYAKTDISQEELNQYIKEDLSKTVNVQMKQTNINKSMSLKYFFNFSNYTILATAIFVIGAVMTAFNEKKIRKRNIISKTNYKKINVQLFLGNIVLTLFIWLIYIVLCLALYPDALCTKMGGLYVLNSLVFCIPVLSIGFFIGNIVRNKEAQSGIVNVVALGSSFLCGAFVPQEFLSASVLNMAKVLPSYWFIKNNEMIAVLSQFSFKSMQEIFVNMLVMCGFGMAIFVTNGIVNKVRLKDK